MKTRLLSVSRTALAVLLSILASTNLTLAGIHKDASANVWTLTSGPVELRLRQDHETVRVQYFGPAGGPDWPAPAWPFAGSHETAGCVEGQDLLPESLVLKDSQIIPEKADVEELRLRFQHRRLPLELEVRYAIQGDTGVLVRQVKVINRGDRLLHVESLPSLAWLLPAGTWDLDYLWGGWGHERRLSTERLGPGTRSFVSNSGRSSRAFSPWFSLRHDGLKTRYLAQLAWSGNWQMQFDRRPVHGEVDTDPLRVELGVRFDFGGALALSPGGSFETPPAAFTASAGDLDDAANQLHRYQRRFVMARTPANDPPLVQFNSWFPFPGKMTVADMKRCADVAAELGAEVFVLDAGWFNKTNWNSELGDWQADPVAFPNGLKELADHAHAKGMKFGLWFEIECLGTESQMFKQHPDWCFQYNGQAVLDNQRHHLNFAKPEVRQWAFKELDDFARALPLDWVKIDYNIDAGERFDPAGTGRTGDALISHVRSYYGWLDQVRAAHPNLVIENCSSGGMRFDLGMLGHTHTTWLSDVSTPTESVQLAYGSTLEFLPEACNHWMLGDMGDGSVDLGKNPGWWDFMFRVPMNGQFGISSRVFEWNGELKQHAKQAITDYKRIRRVIVGADVYHLTPQPPRDQPSGWAGLQYVSPDRQRSVLMAYRLRQSTREHVFCLRGLAPQSTYRIKIDGQVQREASGQQLQDTGLWVNAEDEWRARIVELEAVKTP